MADQTVSTLTTSLTALRDERAALLQRVEVLDRAIDGVQAAISSLDGSGASASARTATTASKPRKRATKKAAGPRVAPDDLVAALREAGGTATTAALVTALGVADGRNLNGARRQAVDDGRLVVEDGVYRLTEQPATDAASSDTGGDAQQAELTDAEWEGSPTPDGEDGTGDDDLGRRIP